MESFINTQLPKMRPLKFATNAYINSSNQFLPHVALEVPVV